MVTTAAELKTREELDAIFTAELESRKEKNRDNDMYDLYEEEMIVRPNIYAQCPVCGCSIRMVIGEIPPVYCSDECGARWDYEDIGDKVVVRFTRHVLYSGEDIDSLIRDKKDGKRN